MKKTILDLLFDKKFKDEVSPESIKKYWDRKKEDSVSAMASLIAYVLKFKRKDISIINTKESDFSTIKVKSLEQFRQSQTKNNSTIWYSRFAAAASILILFAIGGYWFGQNQVYSVFSKQANVIEFNTPKGQQSEVTLPDGTFVALNYDSKLKYHISPNKRLQEVELIGEAFFKVTKNKSRTFKVITNNMSVNVLGTEFNVRAYNDDQKTVATLLEGSIEIKDILNQKGSVLLKPGEQWSYDKSDNKKEITKVDANQATFWRDGKFNFENIPLSELAITLERMYNVEIHFQDSSLENEVYSGSVFRDDELGKIFEFINLTVPVNIRREKNEIWISRK